MKPGTTSLITLCFTLTIASAQYSTPNRASVGSAEEARPADSRAAYTITYTETSQTGTRPPIGKALYVAQRKDGSTATGSTDPQSFQIRSILLVPEKLMTLVSDQTKRKSTRLAVRQGSPIPPLNVSPRCEPQNLTSSLKLEYLGEDTVTGLKTFKYRMFPPQPTQHFAEQTFWFAPDLDCYALRAVSERRDEVKKTGTRFVKEATSVTLGDPDATIFVMPGNYSEVAPSELLRGSIAERSRSASARGGSPAPPEAPGVKEYYDRLDKRYWEARPQQ